jgi:hypothetical protein
MTDESGTWEFNNVFLFLFISVQLFLVRGVVAIAISSEE